MKVLPRSLLYNKDAMQGLAIFSMPIIRAVDALVGSANAMRVDAWGKGDAAGKKVTLRCVHPDLEDCVGQSTAAFGMELLRGRGGRQLGLQHLAPRGERVLVAGEVGGALHDARRARTVRGRRAGVAPRARAADLAAPRVQRELVAVEEEERRRCGAAAR